MPNAGDELHHFGWNACSSALCPYAPHPHVERRYLIVPGLRSSRIHVLDTKPDPAKPKIVKVIEPQSVHERTGYSRPHTVHCGPDGIYLSALGAPNGDAPGGIFALDHDNFEPLGRWEVERGPQQFGYDFAWHLGYDIAVTSEWGTPNMVENGVNPELLLGGKYGHSLHVWDLRKRRHLQSLDLGSEQQMVLELRPAHDPSPHRRANRRSDRSANSERPNPDPRRPDHRGPGEHRRSRDYLSRAQERKNEKRTCGSCRELHGTGWRLPPREQSFDFGAPRKHSSAAGRTRSRFGRCR